MDEKLNTSQGYHPERIQRETRTRALKLGGIAAAVFIFVLGGCIYLFPLTAFLPKSYGLGPDAIEIKWDLMGSMISLATFALVVSGFAFAFIDYVQNAVQRKREDAEASFNIYQELFDRMMNHEAVEARRWVFENLPTLEEMKGNKQAYLDCVNEKLNEIPPNWTGARPPGRTHLKDILNTLDFIGFVAKHYWNMENELVEWMSSPVSKVWERISVYVEDEADRRKEDDYYESARKFGDHCVEWRAHNRDPYEKIQNAT